MTDGWMWKTRCPESGYLVGDCGCNYCFQEYELENFPEDDFDQIWEAEEDYLEWLESLEEEDMPDEWENINNVS